MRIQIERDAIRGTVALVLPAVQKKSTMPVLSNVLLTADKHLTVGGNDMVMGIRSRTECEIDTKGEVCVNGARLAAILDKLPSGTVELREEKFDLHIKIGASRFKLPGIDPIQFPSFPEPKEDGEEVDLSLPLSTVMHARSDDYSRPELCGVNLNGAMVTATDGHRLATFKMGAPALANPVIIPNDAILPLRDLGQCRLSATDGVLHASATGINFSTRLLEGEYPDVEQVIPTTSSIVATCDPVSFLALIDRVTVLAGRGGMVKLAFGGTCIKAEESSSNGEASDSIEAACSGELEIGVNGKYLIEALKAIPPQSPLRIGLTDNISPILLTSEATDAIRMVLMPMRL